MKEDIKILKDYIKLINKGYCDECNELCNIYGAPSYPSRAISQAIENLLKAYKELKEEKRHTKYLLNKKKFFSDWYIGEIIMCEDIQHLLEEE